ncbi:MAG: response regulator [Treponema sp.]|nr:response regulator [Treponema sp.]
MINFLICEDSRLTRNLIKNYVSDIKLGEEVCYFEASDGEGALDALERNDIDFMLLDWNLSTNMTGLDVLRQVRADERFKNMPIVMVTSASDKPSVIEALKAGSTDFIAKPIDKTNFSCKVQRLVLNMERRN